MADEPQNLSPALARSGWRRWRLPVFFAVWTVFAAGVAWWLVRSAGTGPAEPQLLFDNSQTSPPVGEQIRRWLKIADVNFRGAYPWLLLAPYVFWLASRFLLERGRLRVSLPAHLVACALFVAASRALTSHVVDKLNVVMIVGDRHQGLTWREALSTNSESGPAPNTRETALSIHTIGSPAGGLKTKVVVSADGEEKTIELPSLTNETGFTANLARARSLLTNIHPLAGGLLEPLPQDMGAGVGRVEKGFSSVRSASWHYESRWFSQFLNVLAYCSLAGLAHAVHFYRRLRERERRAVLLESHLANARLHALQARLQPHFLFNALNAVSTLLRRDTQAAQEALTSFSELLRIALNQSDKQEVSLREDLQFAQRYVEIQQTRLGDRFRFEQQVDPSTLDCLVPALLLQPLVENALRHGIELSTEPGVVRVVVQRQQAHLVLSVEDNGAGLAAAGSDLKTGVGLSNLRARLQALYGDDQAVELISRPEGGAAVHVRIPSRLNDAKVQESPPVP